MRAARRAAALVLAIAWASHAIRLVAWGFAADDVDVAIFSYVGPSAIAMAPAALGLWMGEGAATSGGPRRIR